MPARSRTEIYAEILECCRNGCITSLIIHKCNLKYPLFKECMDFLKAKNLIIEVLEEGKTVFKTTEKGHEALDHFAKYYVQVFRDTFKPSTERHMQA